MNTVSFYQQDPVSVFSSPLQQGVDQYNGYFTSLQNIESSLLNLSTNDNTMKMEASFYPSPSESPLPSEMTVVTPENEVQYGTFFHDASQYFDSMMMVPPLAQYSTYDIPVDAFMLAPSFYEHKAPALELVDQFIAQHQAALNVPEQEYKQQQQQQKQQQEQQEQSCKETSWSYWTYSSRDSTPEIVSDSNNDDSSASSSPAPEVVIAKNKKTNKVTKGTGRRGRGKGVKNGSSKKALAAAAAAAAAAVSTSGSTTVISSKEPLDGALYVCQHDDCGRSFTRPYNLTSHMRTHTSDRPYACSHCGRKFARQHDRNRHEKLHWGIRPYACHHCHKSFARMDALNRHLRMENGCTGVHL